MRRVGMTVSLVCALGSVAFPVPAFAAPSLPMVALTGKLMKLADQHGPEVAAVRTADNELVPVEATALARVRTSSCQPQCAPSRQRKKR
jgi:hypothetical protein